MAKVKIDDLPLNEELTDDQSQDISGGKGLKKKRTKLKKASQEASKKKSAEEKQKKKGRKKTLKRR